MSYTDEQLRDAAAFLRQAYYASLPDVSNYHPEYSEEFLQKMDRLCRQYRFRRQAKSFLKTVVAAVVALLITGSVWLGLNVDARAAFRAWLIEIYENTFIYRFFNDPADDRLVNYDIHKLPEGYAFDREIITPTEHIRIYRNGEIPLCFMYFKMSNQRVLGQLAAQRIETKVGKNHADYYSSEDGSSNDLVWFDEDKEMVFCLSGFFTEKEMIAIADNVALK